MDTFFKTPDGFIYGVSQRIIDAGYNPIDGSVEASGDEIYHFSRVLTKEEKISNLQKLLDIKILTEEKFNKAVEDIPNDPEPIVEVIPESIVEEEPVVEETEPVVEVIPEPVEKRANSFSKA